MTIITYRVTKTTGETAIVKTYAEAEAVKAQGGKYVIVCTPTSDFLTREQALERATPKRRAMMETLGFVRP